MLYLGPDSPISEIGTAARCSRAKVVGLSAAVPATEERAKNLSELRHELPRGVGIWIGGRGWSSAEAPSGVRHVGSLEELTQHVLRRSMKAWNTSRLQASPVLRWEPRFALPAPPLGIDLRNPTR